MQEFPEPDGIGAAMKEEERRVRSLTLGVHRIEPVDLDNPMMQAALEQARRALANPQLRKILQIRTAVQHYLADELIRAGYVHPPVYMLAGCTDPLNHWTYPARINYYGEEVSITQSLIFQKILLVMLSPVDKVFWASPNIRMEMRIARKEYKYAAEFMQVDFEKRDGSYEEMIEFISGLVRGLYHYLNENHGEIIREFRGQPLPELPEKLSVYDAVDVKKREGLDGDALELFLSRRQANVPFLLVNLAREAYDCFDERAGRFLNYDLILPPCGNNPHTVECLSGAERTRSLANLKRRMLDLGYPIDYFAPFFELFSTGATGSGSISCAGAGFGIERMTWGLLGLKDIHEVYPFPRIVEGRIAI